MEESSLLETRLPNSNKSKKSNKRKKILQGTIKGCRRQHLRIDNQDYIANNEEIYNKKNVKL